MKRMPVAATAAVMAATLMGALTGCGLPVDPQGTLDRIDAGLLRAGASPSVGLVEVAGDAVDGPLAEVVEDFARERGARVEWTVGSEEELVDALEAGKLDLAIGGMTDATPWADRASVTRSYPQLDAAGGRSVVFLLPLGENATQSALERFVDGEVG